MTRSRKIRNVFVGILTIIASVILISLKDYGYLFVAVVISVSLIARGVRSLIYYFTMARHAVGGLNSLFLGIIQLQVGLFLLALYDMPRVFVMAYLISIYAFKGIIDVLRAVEEKKLGARTWKFKLITGAVNILVAVFALVCGVILKSSTIMVYIYCGGLLISAAMRIASAFRKDTVPYFQP